VAHSGDVVAEKESPVADAVEPGVNFIQARLGDVQIFSEARDDADSGCAADRVAEADAAPAAG